METALVQFQLHVFAISSELLEVLGATVHRLLTAISPGLLKIKRFNSSGYEDVFALQRSA